jgi:L,D-peptidoglycan transpeptidase YkuD (ErfK/YbiS/YcfS/YnhG family)
MKILFVRIGTLLGILWMSSTLQAGKLPSDTRQLLVVVSPDWRADHGTLTRWEKRGESWKRVGAVIPVKLGKNGMAWGRGLYAAPPGAAHKREGDGRSPAGIFELPFLLGEGASEFRYPYRRMDRFSRCVDDPRSRSYNQIVDSRRVPQDYRSYERMKFPSGLYRYGIFVAHNPKRIPGAGSCIFMHIKRRDGRPTVGCTAMSSEALRSVMHWLDPRKHPLLIQAPREAIRRLLPDNFQLTNLR